MLNLLIAILMLLSPALVVTGMCEESDVFSQVKWQEGPAKVSLGDKAEVELPEGYSFADAADTKKLMEAMHNPTDGSELGFIMPDEGDWFILFEYSDAGYIKDDEKDDLDADELLKQIREGNEAANELRAEKGWDKIEVIGWEVPPHYNNETNNLEWCIKGKGGAGISINHIVKLLGRRGYMNVTLVTDPEQYASVVPSFDTVVGNFSYKPGNKYAEYVQGDKVAEYGLAALVVGGAAAAATKTGLLKGLWKFILVGIVAVGGFLKKLFGGKSEA